MPKDVIITPASGLVDFQGNTGISSATIQLDNNGNLNIANPGGDLTLGDTSRDIFIGDGVNNVDIVFEQDGEIRGLTNKTVSLGQTDSYVKIVGALKDSNNQVGTANSVLLSTGSGIKWETIATASLQGRQGIQGIQGQQGIQGIQGQQGIQGIQGRQGIQGIQGQQGIQGIQGQQGIQGIQGQQGIQGIQGRQGIQGANDGGVTVINDELTNASRYVVFEDTVSGVSTSVGISTSKLTFNPSTGTLSATVFTSLSDETQKTNIRPIENALELVTQMNGVYYDWKDGHNSSSIGVIAQEIEKVIPEVVTTNDRGLKTVSYGNLIGVLIEAIKEQQIRIEELERKINA